MIDPFAGRVTLVVDGAPYTVWTDVNIDLSVTEMTGKWTLEVSDSRTNPTPGLTSAIAAVANIEPDSKCTVLYDGMLVCTGIVDNVQPSYDADAHGMQVSCRGMTRNLVDGAAEIPNQEARKIKYGDLVKKIAEPYGVPVSVEVPSPEIPVARPHVTEPAERMIARYSRQEGVLAHEDENGTLRLRRVENTAPVAALVEGVNIVAGRSNLKAHKKPSKIKVLGQEPGTDQKFGEPVATVNAEAKADNAKWNRPLHVFAETAVAPDKARQRADWEAATRAAEVVDANVTYHGWSYASGKLWRPGDIVELKSPMLRVHRALAIKSLKLSQNSEGTRAELTLVPPESLSPQGKGAGQGAGKAKAGKKGGTPAGGNTSADAPPRTPDTSDWWLFTKPGHAV